MPAGGTARGRGFEWEGAKRVGAARAGVGRGLPTRSVVLSSGAGTAPNNGANLRPPPLPIAHPARYAPPLTPTRHMLLLRPALTPPLAYCPLPLHTPYTVSSRFKRTPAPAPGT